MWHLRAKARLNCHEIWEYDDKKYIQHFMKVNKCDRIIFERHRKKRLSSGGNDQTKSGK